MKDANKRVVVVTGATQGIGRSIAIQLSKQGYSVHGVFNSSLADAKDLQQKHDIHFHQADLSKRDRTVLLANRLATLKPFALINNAGIFEMDDLSQAAFGTWDRTIEVNLTAPLILSRTIGAAMDPGSSIVNISSTDGILGAYDGISYSASKAGLISITKSLGNTFGPRGVRVNAIAPGWIETAMVDDNAVQNAQETNPMQRTAKAEEIAHVVEFLISSKASYINGETIIVDGGGINVDYGLKKESGY